MHAITTTNSFQ